MAQGNTGLPGRGFLASTYLYRKDVGVATASKTYLEELPDMAVRYTSYRMKVRQLLYGRNLMERCEQRALDMEARHIE